MEAAFSISSPYHVPCRIFAISNTSFALSKSCKDDGERKFTDSACNLPNEDEYCEVGTKKPSRELSFLLHLHVSLAVLRRSSQVLWCRFHFQLSLHLLSGLSL